MIMVLRIPLIVFTFLLMPVSGFASALDNSAVHTKDSPELLHFFENVEVLEILEDKVVKNTEHTSMLRIISKISINNKIYYEKQEVYQNFNEDNQIEREEVYIARYKKIMPSQASGSYVLSNLYDCIAWLWTSDTNTVVLFSWF